jgi:hypothetical protein
MEEQIAKKYGLKDEFRIYATFLDTRSPMCNDKIENPFENINTVFSNGPSCGRPHDALYSYPYRINKLKQYKDDKPSVIKELLENPLYVCINKRVGLTTNGHYVTAGDYNFDYIEEMMYKKNMIPNMVELHEDNELILYSEPDYTGESVKYVNPYNHIITYRIPQDFTVKSFSVHKYDNVKEAFGSNTSSTSEAFTIGSNDNTSSQSPSNVYMILILILLFCAAVYCVSCGKKD